MNTSLASAFGAFEQLRYGRDVLRQEAVAVTRLADELGTAFCDAVDVVAACQGSVIVTGMGKCGYIAQKIAATLASTGAPAHFLHPAEAVHGDLGRIRADDVVIVLSHSGETGELTEILPSLHRMAASIIAITGNEKSTLAETADVVLPIGVLREADTHNLAPSTSTTAMLALGDALALTVCRQRGFQAENFAQFHPGGSLGRKLAVVEDCMRPLQDCRVAVETEVVREMLVRLSRPGRRTGAILVTDANGRLTGIFTDSDLARLLEARREDALDGSVGDVMTHRPTTIEAGQKMTRAATLLSQSKISELPVIAPNGRPLGLIDITDVVGFTPETEPATLPFPQV